MTDKNPQETPQMSEPVTVNAPRIPKPLAFEPQGEVRQVKVGTKLASLIDLLAEGATMEQLLEGLSRTGSAVDPSGVRSWLSYDLRRAGYGVRQEGDRLHLVLPGGMTVPLAHKEAAPTKVAEATTRKVEPTPTKKAAMRPPKKSTKAAPRKEHSS
jgi:hypothetical protein